MNNSLKKIYYNKYFKVFSDNFTHFLYSCACNRLICANRNITKYVLIIWIIPYCLFNIIFGNRPN